jgi:hypothetical protein
MLGCLAGWWLAKEYMQVFMPYAGLEGVVPAVIGMSIGTILGMVAGIAWLPHVIRHLGIRWGLVLFLVAVLVGSVLLRLYQGVGVFTFVLVLAAGLGLLWDLLRWEAWPLR